MGFVFKMLILMQTDRDLGQMTTTRRTCAFYIEKFSFPVEESSFPVEESPFSIEQMLIL